MDNDFGYQSMLKCLLLIIYRCKIDNKTKTWRTCHWSFKYILNVKCLLTAFSKLNNETLNSVFKQHERCLSIYKNFKHLWFHDWDLLKTWVFTCVSESPCDYVYSTWESSCFYTVSLGITLSHYSLHKVTCQWPFKMTRKLVIRSGRRRLGAATSSFLFSPTWLGHTITLCTWYSCE